MTSRAAGSGDAKSWSSRGASVRGLNLQGGGDAWASSSRGTAPPIGAPGGGPEDAREGGGREEAAHPVVAGRLAGGGDRGQRVETSPAAGGAREARGAGAVGGERESRGRWVGCGT